MKKLIFIILSVCILWGGYEAVFIWTRLDVLNSDIGRVHIVDRRNSIIANLPKK